MKKLDKSIMLSCVATLILIIATLCCVANAQWTSRQDTAHQIAELARELSLEESDPIIVRAQEIWYEEEKGIAVLFEGEE